MWEQRRENIEWEKREIEKAEEEKTNPEKTLQKQRRRKRRQNPIKEHKWGLYVLSVTNKNLALPVMQ